MMAMAMTSPAPLAAASSSSRYQRRWINVLSSTVVRSSLHAQHQHRASCSSLSLSLYDDHNEPLISDDADDDMTNDVDDDVYLMRKVVQPLYEIVFTSLSTSKTKTPVWCSALLTKALPVLDYSKAIPVRENNRKFLQAPLLRTFTVLELWANSTYIWTCCSPLHEKNRHFQHEFICDLSWVSLLPWRMLRLANNMRCSSCYKADWVANIFKFL